VTWIGGAVGCVCLGHVATVQRPQTAERSADLAEMSSPRGAGADAAASSPLRIALVAPPWFEIPPQGYGGIERMCFDLAQGLVARGNDVTLIATGTNRTRAKFVQVLPQPLTGLGEIDGPVQEVRYAASVARVLPEIDVDLVHDHSLAGPLLGLGRSVPTMLTAHGPTDGHVGDYYRKLRLPLIAISNAQRVAAPDLPWVGTVHNAIDVHRFPFRVTKEDFVLFLGRLSPEKGAHLAPDACRAAGYSLLIAGKCKEKEERRYFEEEVAPRLGPDTTWLGEVHGTQKMELLSRARCLLAPVQWEEPFGLTSIEALACGTPVVALRRGAISEIVEHGRTGWVCDDPSELPEAIRCAAEIDPRACRMDALRRFHTSTMVVGYEQMYRTVLQTRAG
jgi:glycosyltransferase involved in cell wall biosynthesis